MTIFSTISLKLSESDMSHEYEEDFPPLFIILFTTDKGLFYLESLSSIEWLNLFQTNVGDGGVVHLTKHKSLQYLPIGKTKISDIGLARIKKSVAVALI